MRLLRVQVPDFRVLKNIDISFEKDFFPQIFPIGSQNGGGKSTLLQLIFILLHCSGDPEKIEYVVNLLDRCQLEDELEQKPLAIFEILTDNREKVKLDFFICRDAYIKELLSNLDGQEEGWDNINIDDLKISDFKKLKDIDQIIDKLKDKYDKLMNLANKFLTERENLIRLDEGEDNFLLALGIFKLSRDRILYLDDYSKDDLEVMQKTIRVSLQQTNNELGDYYYNCEILFERIEIIKNILGRNKFVYLCQAKNQKNEEIFLLCKFSQTTQEEFQLFMKELSSKIFLAAPSTQVFIFLPKATNKSLFQINQGNPDSSNYYLAMADIKKKLSNLFTYDFLPVELLINYFIMARDQDFAQAIETGEYGNNYQLIRQNLNLILSDKEINLDKDISGITFKFKGDINGEELYPEDLSHGELKRLSIYLWLKYRRIKDAIVLMDEIEIALHPDWQYKIIEDLQEWEPSNQYILATHSYELCQALTPAHVKEIEPKLLK
ncbi:MAG: AAA family ATPase [Microcystis aeruginosa W11-06]|nr:AAA family ATPase [Microcystis aeruginosa W11-03]NCR94851.1 AAA family ATPase [Microcystis aeruginosa W11-06]